MAEHWETLMTGDSESDSSISISVGLEHWHTGETTLNVHPDGRAIILNRQSGKETTYQGTLSEEQVSKLDQALLGFEKIDRGDRPRRPDDVPVRIYHYHGDEVVEKNEKLWSSDRRRLPQVNEIVKQFNLLVKQLTDGALPY